VKSILSASELRPLTDRTVTAQRALLAELKRVREQGYAVNDQELSLGLRGVAAPVLGREERPIAAINLSLPHPVNDADIRKELAPKVMRAAREIGQQAVQMGVEVPGA
jgi:IclR family pca regulon transcriptional regulator